MKVFIDCGFHHGEGLTHFIDLLGIDHTWVIVCFEPNPACDTVTRQKQFKERGLHIGVFNYAVWTEYGSIAFCQENHLKSNSGSPHDNVSSIDGWASQVQSLQGVFPGLEEPIMVPCIDFSSWFKGFNSMDEVYCKMDIEGSEFPVLRKMLYEGTVRAFKKMWIEFHERFIPGETIKTKNELITELSKFTEIEEWH